MNSRKSIFILLIFIVASLFFTGKVFAVVAPYSVNITAYATPIDIYHTYTLTFNANNNSGSDTTLSACSVSAVYSPSQSVPALEFLSASATINGVVRQADSHGYGSSGMNGIIFYDPLSLPAGSNAFFVVIYKTSSEIVSATTISINADCTFGGGSATSQSYNIAVSQPDSCAGKTCGCGSLPACCTPACTNKQCGSDNCGGSCGTCASGKTCNSSSQCVADSQDPCAGKLCGCGSLPACSSSTTTTLSLPSEFTQTGSTSTDVSKLTTDQRKSVSNLTLEVKNVGKIVFANSVDLSSTDTAEKFASLTSFVVFSKGKIGLNSEQLPILNVKARLTMFGLSFPNGTTPKILRNGGDSAEYVSNIVYKDGELNFDVTGFSEYSVVEDSSTATSGNSTTSGSNQTDSNQVKVTRQVTSEQASNDVLLVVVVVAIALILILVPVSTVLLIKKRKKVKSQIKLT